MSQLFGMDASELRVSPRFKLLQPPLNFSADLRWRPIRFFDSPSVIVTGIPVGLALAAQLCRPFRSLSHSRSRSWSRRRSSSSLSRQRSCRMPAQVHWQRRTSPARSSRLASSLRSTSFFLRSLHSFVRQWFVRLRLRPARGRRVLGVSDSFVVVLRSSSQIRRRFFLSGEQLKVVTDCDSNSSIRGHKSQRKYLTRTCAFLQLCMSQSVESAGGAPTYEWRSLLAELLGLNKV